MKHQLFILAGCLACLAACGGDAFEIGEAMADEAFWKSDPVLFIQRHREQGFKFTSESREGADSRLDGGVTCFGVPVYESRIEFAEDGTGIARVELTLYSAAGTESIEEISLGGGKMRRIVRKDKKISRDEFLGILNKVRGKLTPAGSKNPVPVSQHVKGQGQFQRMQTWPKTATPTVTTLTWNYYQEGSKAGTFKPGFVRLAADGPARLAAGASRGTSSSRQAAKGRKTIVDNVIRDPRGDVFVDNVPMVDQGQKGYCAAAAAERVLRYYGVAVDEHEIGQAAGTSAEEGTSSKDMKDSVDMIGRRFKLATVTLYGDFEKPMGERIQSLTKEVSSYNKAAKKLKKPEIAESVYIRREGNFITYDPRAADEAMDPEVLKDMKVNGAQKSRYKKFMSDVHQYVNAGMPLFWSVLLGTYPETDLPQARGGHMRLIIGYNDKKREILYTDTWGKGHELKRMPADWAWTISRCLMVMKPLK